MKRFIAILVALPIAFSVSAQDLPYYKKLVKELSSSRFQGRGYACDGVRKAAKYIEKEFRKSGADEVMFQPFCIDINTFPGAMSMTVDGRKLKPGSGFTMREYSPGVHGTYSLYYIDTLNYNSERIFEDLEKQENKGAFAVCDFWFTYRHKKDFSRLQSKESPNSGIIYTWDTPLKFYKAYGEKVVDKPIVWVDSDFPRDSKEVSFDIDNRFLESYRTENVIAKVNGQRHDSCFVFIAHYDHLGKLGRKVWFPGANDNASGTAAIVTLASHYSKNRPEFDIWFIACSGEEANLRGSSWFVEHPLFPLESIKYLFDLDMIGDNNPEQYCEASEQGLKGLEMLQTINSEKKLFKALKPGKLAANSDHWPFAQKGVPCILFENESGDNFPWYHTKEDNWEKAVFTTYTSIFQLVTSFISNQPATSIKE